MYEFRRQRIKALREGLDLTQEQMADILEKKPQQISIWEAGVNKPSMDNFLQICNTFDTDPGFFFDAVSTTVEETIHEEESNNV